MALLIEQLTQEMGMDKTAEEVEMEKLAQEVNVLDQSRTLIAVGEEMYKIAEELGNEGLAALAVDTYQLGERMGSCLTKTASEDGQAILEALEIAEDMHKIACAYAEIADEAQDEDFNKMASAIVDISNEMTDEANDVYSEMEAAEAEIEKEAAAEKKDGYRPKGIWAGTGIGAGAGAGAGAGIGALLSKKLGVSKGEAAAIGSAIGGLYGSAIGNAGARIKQTAAHNKDLGHKHNILRALTPTAAGEMNRATSTSDQLKALNPGGAIAGKFGRFLHRKSE